MSAIPQKKNEEPSKELNLNLKGETKIEIKVYLIKTLFLLGSDNEKV